MEKLNVDFFIRYAQKYKSILSNPSISVEALIAIYERAILYGDEHLYTDPYLLIQLASGAQGTCFLHLEDWDTKDFDMIAGKSVYDVIQNSPNHIKIALLDAIFHHINILEHLVPNEEYKFLGSGSEKSISRAKKIIELAGISEGCKVALVGLIVDILKMAIENGAQVKAADLAEYGKIICNVAIEKNAVPLVGWSDIAIITGNTLKTDTLDELLKVAKENSVKVLIYSMTGHNISPRYIDFGADIVTSEDFPFYWYAYTPSIMRVFRKKDGIRNE